ncbi:hypothetical protein L2E82_16751 [Cichorium intybus]|uniref:Uncharacterized protein n=1 Tax=Cichorium intybus TaxID=13427 RepID=A0ACB9F6F0_CICIN|nr:hypothetical protein L2E82_16751 [Cichorium intybus]
MLQVSSQIARRNGLQRILNLLKKNIGFKLRVLAQNYPDTPGLSIKDLWQLDDRTIVFVANPTFGKVSISVLPFKLRGRIAAMILVWQYEERSGYEYWKGLSWGMVPLLLRGAFCACAWHFFYNSESLEVWVAIQGALMVIGNATMCIAAYRIYK